MSSTVTAADWIKGISLSILASIIGGASKLAIRKSWLLQVPLESAPRSPSRSVAQRRRSQRGLQVLESATLDAAPPEEHSSVENLHAPTTSGTEQHVPRTPQPIRLRHLSLTRSSSMTDAPQPMPKRSLALPYVLRGCGMLGMTLLNPLCCVLAMQYASPSILAPFSGMTLVWIVLFAPVIGERASETQRIAAALIVAGEVVVAVYGDHTNNQELVTVQDVIASYQSPAFVVFFAALAVWMLLLWYWMIQSHSPILQKFAWGVAGGSITGLQNFLKDGLALLSAPAAERKLALEVFFVVMAIVTALSGLLLLTACMKRYDATYSSAMFVGSFVWSASLMAGVHYHTWKHLISWMNRLMYPTGLAILLGGVYLLIHESEQQEIWPLPGTSLVGEEATHRPLVSQDDEDQEDDSRHDLA